MSYSYSRGLSWPVLLFVIVLVFILVGIGGPFIFSRMSPGGLARANLTGATRNAHIISKSLGEFRKQNGSFPDQRSREMLLKKRITNLFTQDGITHLSESDDANAYLAQLLAAEIINNEEVFDSYDLRRYQKGDNVVDSLGVFLSPGENGFAYIMAESGEALKGENESMPLILAPIVRGGRHPRFDPEPYGGRFVCGMADGSVRVGKIADDGSAMPIGGVPLFEAGPDTIWGDQIPVVKMPLKNPDAP